MEAPGISIKAEVPGPAMGLNVVDLELIHVYSTSTYATLSQSPTVRGFWRHTVPRLGLEHGYVIREILAIAALHLSHHRPDQREHYMSIALMHHREATQEAMALLKELAGNNTTGLFVFSVLTVLIGMTCRFCQARRC